MIPQFNNLTTSDILRHCFPSESRWFKAVIRLACALVAILALGSSCWAQATMTINFVDEKTGEPIPCRVELRDAKGKPQKGRGALQHAPWSIVESQLIFRGKAGDYTFDVHHGPEYAGGGGGFTLDKDGEGADVVRLPRHANMADENYFAADRLTFIPAASMPKWLPAEALQSATICSTAPIDASNVITKQSAGDGRWFSHDSYYDDRPGSGLVFHHWSPPAAVPESLPSTRLLVLAKQKTETRAEIVRLWARDTPQWLASGRIDAIQILSEHLTRDGKTPIKVSDMYHPEPANSKGRAVQDAWLKIFIGKCSRQACAFHHRPARPSVAALRRWVITECMSTCPARFALRSRSRMGCTPVAAL